MKYCFVLLLSCALCGRAAIWYVDYESGSDSNAGTSKSAPLKTCPAGLKPGDTVLFKGGVVYRGSIQVPASGKAGARIVYKGDGWGDQKAIVDGADLLDGWESCASAEDAGGNPDFKNLFYTFVPADRDPFLMNLHELNSKSGEDEFLWIAQSPNPADFYFFNVRDGLHPVKHENLTRTSIASPDFLTQTDSNHWKGSSVLVWVNPNWTIRREIREFIPAENKIIIDELNQNAIYKDGRDQGFAIYNSPHAINTPGEYAVMPPNADGLRRVVLWPRSAANLEQRVSCSVRQTGFDIGANSHIEIAGFEIRKFAGSALRTGCGILAYGGLDTELNDIVLRDNLITHNKHGSKGYGGIYANQLRNSRIENNTVVKNPLHAGIFLSSCEDSIVRGNTIQYTGNTALRLYTSKRMQVVNNRINHIYSTHANGITLYLGCTDVLVANNVVTDAVTPITHQNSANLYFINNVTDGQGVYKNVNEWPLSKNGAQEFGKIVYLNNTFVNAGSDASLNLGRGNDNEYIVLNNILDGMSFTTKNTPKLTLHNHNIFVGRGFSQTAQYGWTDGDAEQDASPANLFENPEQLNFHLKPESPAIGAGTDVSSYWPTELFPEFDFKTDVTGKPRQKWDVGAYTE